MSVDDPARALLSEVLRALEPLADDAVAVDSSARRAWLDRAREAAGRLDEQLHSAPIGATGHPGTQSGCPNCTPSSAPDPQVLRAIADIRTLRRETVRERKARVAAEADLHREGLETVRLLLSFLERRWAERVSQCRAAARLAARLATGAGLAAEEARGVQVATLIQDVGLIALPDALLRTNVLALSPAERALYQQHPVIGEEALGGGEFAEIGKWIRHHHERWDGNGYPDGLSGAEIPLPARIVALATGHVEAAAREGGTAIAWRREQLAAGAFDPALLRLLEGAVRPRRHG